VLILDFLTRVFNGGYPDNRVRWKMGAEYSTSYDFSKNVRLA
jgi:hypothetical protein